VHVKTNIAELQARGKPAAWIEGDTLVLDNFRERDPQVLALVRDAEDLETAVHHCLEIGSRALTSAKATIDVAVVETAFGEMTSMFSRGIESFAGELETKTKELLDGEDGALPRSLVAFRTELEELLDGTFDPDSRSSALAKLDDVMQRVAADQVKAMRRLIDPENEESPLSRYRSEIVKSVRDETSKVQKAVQELATQLAVEEAKAEVFELTAKKGFTFEEELEIALVKNVCGPLGDVAERVGGTAGARGKKGDFTVALNPDDTAGQDVSYVIEAKNQKLTLRDTLRELDQAIANRGSLAGIAVFAKTQQCPGAGPFQYYGNRAVVVFDPSDRDDLALRLACSWARWVARRQLGTGVDKVDLERIGALIDDARQALRLHGTISTALKTSKTKIDHALGHVADLVVGVETALAGITNEIAV
jgi:hypothetical protein